MATNFAGGGRAPRLFYAAMGTAIALLVFAGFARSYYLARWLTPPARTPPFTPLLHIHAAAFSLWILVQAAQPLLIRAGRRMLHRRIGLCAAGLAAAVWLLGNIVSAKAMNVGYKGLGDPYAFYAITFFSMQAFGVILLLGFVWWKRPETHKRLMLLSNAAILEAAVGRLPFQIVEETAPLSFYVGADLVILAGVAHDLLRRGRVHPVWLWGGGALIASQALRVVIMDSAPWLAFAHAVARLV